MKKESNKMFKCIMGHRKVFTIVFMVIAILLMIIPQFFMKTEWFTTDDSRIEILCYSSQITSALFVIFGAIVAVWQYYLSSTKKMNDLNYARIEKAIELSNYYKDNILNRYALVKKVFDEYGLVEMLEAKRKSIEIQDFDTIELDKIFSEDEIKKFEKIFTDEKFVNVLVKMNQSYNVGLKGANIIKNVPSLDGNVKVEVVVNRSELINDFYQTYITGTLNNAEYFAMAFTHKTADETVIYQSIYPSYLEMCYIMYYFIARDSDPAVCKLYTNVAELYCMWRKKEKEQKEQIANSTRFAGKQIGTVLSDDN